MKRIFGKGAGHSKSEQSDVGTTEVKDGTESMKTREESKSQKIRHRKTSIGQASIEDERGQGVEEAEPGRRARSNRAKEIQVMDDEDEDFRKVREQKQKHRPSGDSVEPFDSSNDDDGDDKTTTEFVKAPPKPLPRRVQGSTSLFSPSDSEGEDEESGGGHDRLQEVKDVIHDTPGKKSRKGGAKDKHISKETVTKKSQQRTHSSGFQNESGGSKVPADDAMKFVSITDSPNFPKIDVANGGHYFSSVYNYKQPISSFRFRARLLRYPSLTDQQHWSGGEMAVVDDRIFQWQEKVFSKSEAKRYQKLDNCLSEQERKYYDVLSESKKSVGRYLYSYVNDDPYTIKKKMKLLTRRCPVPHTRNKEKSFSRLGLDASTRSLNSDDSPDLGRGREAGNGDNFSDDSIDFDEPVSSSTPMQGRKGKENKDASEIAKTEKKARERKEKEMKDLEKRSAKLKEEAKKKKKNEEKMKQQEEAKILDKMKKLDAIESKEEEFRAAYMKKYKYSKRPSIPLGARIRSVRLTPSPRKLDRKKKSYTVSRSSEISDDFKDEEDVGSGHSLESKEDRKLNIPPESSSKVGTEYDKYNLRRSKLSSMGVKVGSDVREKGSHLNNAQIMHIMASIPYLPGKSKEMLVCSVKNIPNQQIMILKPAIGYRNIETKRNNVLRISYEILPLEEEEMHQQTFPEKAIKKGYPADENIYGDLGLFENVPKNEFRLSVLGEITMAHGFDTSPVCIYYAVDIPNGWRNDSLQSNTEGMTHTCFTDHNGCAHFSHEFSFQLVFSMDFFDEPEKNRHFPTPVIALMAVSINHPSPRIVYEGYGYVTVPMTPGCHAVKIRMWKPRPRTVVERMRAAFLDISPSLQEMKLAHISPISNDETGKANLIGLQTDPSGTVKLRLHVIHQSPLSNQVHENNLDLLEKMSSATILRSVQAVIQAFQRVRQKAETLNSQCD